MLEERDAEIAALRIRERVLLSALKPFAKAGAHYNRAEAATALRYADEGVTYTPHSDYYRVSVALGDLRRAAAAYHTHSEGCEAASRDIVLAVPDGR